MKSIICKLFIITILIGIISMIFMANVHADNKLQGKKVDYSQTYKNWLELSDEEKKNTIEPFKYNTITNNKNQSIKNIFKLNQKLKAGLTTKYDLREILPENMIVRNQMETNACWAFATIGSLESNLAMQNYKKSLSAKVYDFSEMHMNYATARTAFLNGKINQTGINRQVSDGGNVYNALMYLSNGSGAIKETDMPYENTQENIDISRIQNKEVVTTLNDMEFLVSETDTTEQLKSYIKEYIKEYGGIAAQIHGNSIFDSECYNNETGAIYCDDKKNYKIDHGILIVGWDDNYSANNFNENCRPTNNGAWIIKNSWGEQIAYTYTLDQLRQLIFESKTEELMQLGYNSASDIPQNIIESRLNEMNITKKEDGTYEYVIKIGDNGFMYVSYEDVNIYQCLWGIQKAEDSKDYEKIYQNDELGTPLQIQFNLPSRMYIANVFKRDNKIKEKINKISIMTLQEYKNCKVYINPNGDSRKKEQLQEVSLKDGESVNILPGYRTIEFAEPISINSDKFAVLLEFEVDNGEEIISIESNKVEEYENATINVGESFVGVLGTDTEEDMALIQNEDIRGNVSLKAFSKIDNSGEDEESPTGNNEEKILSNFDNSTVKMTNGKIKIKPNDIENSSVEAKIIIENIKKGSEDATYTYSYYISDTKGDKNIKEEYWTPTDSTLVKEDDGTYSLTISIDSEKLKNYREILDGDNLYLYLRETATKDGKQEIDVYTFKIEFDNEIEVDGDTAGKAEEIVNRYNTNDEVSLNSRNGSSLDTTVANKILPNTGYIPLIIVSLGILLIIGVFAYIRFKNIDK